MYRCIQHPGECDGTWLVHFDGRVGWTGSPEEVLDVQSMFQALRMAKFQRWGQSDVRYLFYLTLPPVRHWQVLMALMEYYCMPADFKVQILEEAELYDEHENLWNELSEMLGGEASKNSCAKRKHTLIPILHTCVHS